MGDAWGHPFVKQGQEVLWPPTVRIPEWRGRAGGAQWSVMPSKGDAGRCRGVYVAHKSDTARDASRRERNFLIGKSCESPRLKGVPFVEQCSSNHLTQRWAQARAEHGNAAAGTGLGATAVVKQSRRLRIRAGQRPTAVERGLLPGGPPKVAASCHRRGARCSCRVTASPFLAGGKLPTVPQSGCFGYDKFGCPCLILTPMTFIQASKLDGDDTASATRLVDANERPSSCSFMVVLLQHTSSS